MKYLLIFAVCLISTQVFGQNGFIETKYGRTGFSLNRLQHSRDNIRLDDDALQRIFENNAASQNFLQTGRKNKSIGVPLLIIGGAGLVSSLFIDEGSWLLFNSSLVVGIAGEIFINSHIRNRMRAVNNYNNELYGNLAVDNAEPLIQLEYLQDPFRVISYYQEGNLLDNNELTALFSNQESLRDLMKKANTQRGIGTGLLAGGFVGALSPIFIDFEQDRTRAIVIGSSLATMISGAIVLNASRANRQSAVNLYNKQLFESATGTATLNFKLNPNAGGLVLSF